MNSNSNSFSDLFWFPKARRAAGSSVIPKRACQEKSMKELSLGTEQDRGEAKSFLSNPTCRALRTSDWKGRIPQRRDRVQKQKSTPESLRKQQRRASWTSRTMIWRKENQSDVQVELQD